MISEKKIWFKRNPNSATWNLIEQCYNIIKQLEDGCSVQDITLLVTPPAPMDRVSSAVSTLVLAANAPVTSERRGQRHTNLRAIAPLPDTLYDNPARERRTHHIEATSKALGALERMNRKELLELKLKINALLALK